MIFRAEGILRAVMDDEPGTTGYLTCASDGRCGDSVIGESDSISFSGVNSPDVSKLVSEVADERHRLFVEILFVDV